MASRKNRKKKHQGRRPRRPRRRDTANRATRAEVHVQVAVGGARLDEAATLVKPAILYADKVTIYSPVASMLDSVRRFAAVSDPRQRTLLMLEVMQQVPSLASHVDIDPRVLAGLRQFLALDPRVVHLNASSFGGPQVIDAMYEQIDALGPIWEEQFPDAIQQIEENAGGTDLLAAIDAGAVALADISRASSGSLVAEAVNAALGEQQSEAVLDEFLIGFTDCIVEILSDNRSFPLLDDNTSGLVRAFVDAAGLAPSELAMRHGAEITSASGVMGFLPSFTELPMDEILDLRTELIGPLGRFRSAWARVSREFSARSFDEGFNAEVEEAWRVHVEPALLEIRETLSDHGLLRETASIALGNPQRLMMEAGGVVAAAHAEVGNLSGMMVAGLAAAVPTTDLVARAVQSSMNERRGARRHPFYFVHRLRDEAVRRAS